jgi:hypothetical protein
VAELPTQRDFDDFSAWTGRDVVAPDGERLGAVELIFLDEATDVPEWVLVRLGEQEHAAFVPLVGATVQERSIRVEQDRERIAAAPRLDVDKTLTITEVQQLYDHYGLAYSQRESPTVLPEGAIAGQPAGERPRLRKYVGSPVPSAPQTSPAESAAAVSATPIPGPAPKVIPPEGGFQAQAAADEGRGGPLARLTKKRALPIVLAGGIAGLIGLLVLRRRR